MSNFQKLTRHPITGNVETANWLDDYFGKHVYGVRFEDGRVFNESEIKDEPVGPNATNSLDSDLPNT